MASQLMIMSSTNEFDQLIGPSVGNWSAAAFPDRAKELVGVTVKLLPYDADLHSELLYNAINEGNNGSSWTYLPYGPFNDFSEFKKAMLSFSSASDVVTYTVLDLRSNKIVGTCSYLRIVPEHGVIEIGHIHFSNLMKRSTASTESIFLLLR